MSINASSLVYEAPSLLKPTTQHLHNYRPDRAKIFLAPLYVEFKNKYFFWGRQCTIKLKNKLELYIFCANFKKHYRCHER